MKTIWTIIKKELKRFFTDKRTLLAIFLPGIALYLIYSVMGSFMADAIAESSTITEASVCVKNEPTELVGLLNIPNIEIQHYDDLSEEEALEKVKNKELDLYVSYEHDFYSKMNSYNALSGDKAPDVKVYYNSAKVESSAIASFYVESLNGFESTISNKFDINADENITYDFATQEESSAQLLTMIVPFLLTVMLFSSSMGLCAESVAGEKERGTIATLLATPVKRWQLALGKVIPLGIVCMCAGIVSSLGAILSIPKLMEGSGAAISLAGYGVGGFLLLGLMVTLTCIMFASVLCIFSTFAKSVKESSSLCMIPMGITFGVGILGMFSTTASTSWWAYLIPVYNSMQCFTQVISMSINPLFFLISIVSNIVVIALSIFAVGKMFNSEKIMFAK